MKSSDIRNMKPEDLEAKEKELRRELFNLKLQNATGQAENPIRIKLLKKDIARVQTIANENKVEAAS